MATTELGLKIMFVETTATEFKYDSCTLTTDKKVDPVTRDMKKDETSHYDDPIYKLTEYSITMDATGSGYTRKRTETIYETYYDVDSNKKITTITKRTRENFYTSTVTRTDGTTISKYNTDGITIGDTSNVVPKLIRITFNREVYKPNEVIADIQLTASKAPSIDDVKTLLGKEVKILRYTRKVDGTSTSESTDRTYTGFYIYDVLPLKASGKELVVRAHIFSLDHQLTRKKYSRTYVGKKLFNDILLEGITDFSTDYTKANPSYLGKPSLLHIPFPTYYRVIKDIISSDKKKLTENSTYTEFDHLSYDFTRKNGATVDNNKAELDATRERIQPYLVQYNESFYDFMVRTCNRCGEFFFWDNGALRVGRTATGTVSTIPEDKCLSVFYTATHLPGADLSFDNDYYTLDDLNDLKKAPKLNTSAQGSSLNTISTNDGFYYNDEVNHDVYRTRIYKGKWDDFDSEMVGNENKYGVSFLSKVLNSTSIFDIVKGYGAYELFRTTEAAAARDYTNRTYDELYIPPKTVDKSGDKDTCLDKRPHLLDRRDAGTTVKDYISLFSTSETEGHLDHTFYHRIRKEEEQLSNQLIVFNLSEPKDFAIGQEITYNSTTYVVIQIKDNPATNSSSKDYFSDIDPDAATPFARMGNAVMQVVAIPLGTKDKVYPPLHPAGHIRRSEPQVALVSEVNDPQKRGRVRIVYPWQQREDAEASPWIRVLTPSAVGAAFEFVVGNEVLIDYEAGNIERPYVAGALFNRQNSAPSRGDMAFVSKNGHSIKFSNPIDDRYFATSISPAYGWIKKLIGPSAHGTKDSLKLTGGITISDAYGFYKIAMSTDQRKIDIASPFGDVKISAFTGITLSAPNGNINIKGQNINIEAGNKLTLTSGTNIKNKSYVGFLNGPSDSPQTKEDNLKNFFATLLGEKVFEGTMDFIKPLVTGVDLNLLRTIIQVFLRPIDGTLEIHSFKYMLLEAGKGEATVEPNRYRTDKIRENHLYNNPTFSSTVNLNRNLEGYAGIIPRIRTIVDSVIDALNTNGSSMNTAKTTYDTRAATVRGADAANSNLISALDIVNENKEKKNPKVYDKKALKLPDTYDDSTHGLITLANDLAQKVCNYYQAKNLGEKCENEIVHANLTVDHSNTSTILYDTMKKKAKDAMKKVISFAQKQKYDLENLTPNVDNLKKYARIIWFETIIKGDSLILINEKLKEDDASNWTDFVDGLSINPTWQSKLKAKAIGYLASIGTQYTDFVNQTFRDWDHWDASKDGQIIYSEKSDESYYFDDSLAPKSHKNGYNEGSAPTVTLANLQSALKTWSAPAAAAAAVPVAP